MGFPRKSENAMAFKPTTDGCRGVILTHKGGNIIGSNHFWFKKTGFNDEDMDSLGDGLRTFVIANNGIKDYVGTAISWSFRLVDERTYDGRVLLFDENDDGEDITELYDVQAAMILTLYTGLRGRAYRGRLYFFGWCEDGLTSGLFNAAAKTALNNSIDAFRTSVLLAQWQWCVRTSQINGVEQNPRFLTPITNWSVRSDIPGVQTRRAQRP